MGSSKRTLEYLDLARQEHKAVLTLDKEKLICFDLRNSHMHTLYFDNPHMNSLTDLILGIIYNIQRRDNFRSCDESFKQQIKELNINLDFLKNQLSSSHQHIKEFLKMINEKLTRIDNNQQEFLTKLNKILDG